MGNALDGGAAVSHNLPAMQRVITGILATAFFVALLIRADARSDRRGIWLAKPLASLGFVLTAIASGALETPYGHALLVALALSMLGDVLLIDRGDVRFLAGLASFLFGHIAFCAAFVRHGIDARASATASVPLLALGAVVGAWLFPKVDRGMRAPVVAYMGVITTMVALAIGAVARGGTPWIVVGALAFYGSDLSVARDKFVAPGFANRVWGLPLYYAAQIVLACTAAAP
ncbi:MAG: lysoplasmalogenase [Deltaproteobacteria bacterium]